MQSPLAQSIETNTSYHTAPYARSSSLSSFSSANKRNTQSTTHTTGSTHRARLTSLAQHTEHDPHHWLNTQSTTHTTGSTRGSTIPVPYTDPPTDLNTHTYLLFLINQVQRNARNVALDLHHVIQDKVAQYSQAGSPHTCTVYIVG